ncbi:MAG: hypothetical protein HZB53_13845 [Chloroflexi bacterium]|nr:hypothetical protein [Chloroflexota bacterium]
MPTVHATTGVAASTRTNPTNTTAVSGGMGLGKDAFMKLLLAQLRYQDPMQPKDDTQFITQLAQFNTLEQMQSINEAMQAMRVSQEMMQGSNMIGKQVQAITPTDQQTVSGVVTAVKLVGGQVIISIGDKHVLLSQIVSVQS